MGHRREGGREEEQGRRDTGDRKGQESSSHRVLAGMKASSVT
jgi:hypothetical protein